MLRFSLGRLALPKNKKEFMELVKTLRYRTEAPIMDCTSALKESDGDIDVSIQLLRQKGLARAIKKEHRITEHGFLVSCVGSPTSNGAAILTICSETDFAARNAHFQQLCLQAKCCLEEMLNKSGGAILSCQEKAVQALRAAMGDALPSIGAVLGENVRVRAVTPLKIPPASTERLWLGSYTHGTVGVDGVGRFVGLAAVSCLRAGEPPQPEVLTAVARHFVATSGAEGSYGQQKFFGSEEESLGRWLKRHHLKFHSSLVMEFGKEPVEHVATRDADRKTVETAPETLNQDVEQS